MKEEQQLLAAANAPLNGEFTEKCFDLLSVLKSFLHALLLKPVQQGEFSF